MKPIMVVDHFDIHMPFSLTTHRKACSWQQQAVGIVVTATRFYDKTLVVSDLVLHSGGMLCYG